MQTEAAAAWVLALDPSKASPFTACCGRGHGGEGPGTGATPSSQGWHSPPTSLPARKTFLGVGRGGCHCGRWVGAELGAGPPSPLRGGQGLQGRGCGTISSPCLCLSCLLDGVQWQLPQTWTQRRSAAWTSSWWAPVSSRPPLRLSPAEVRAPLGAGPIAWDANPRPGLQASRISTRRSDARAGAGGPHPGALPTLKLGGWGNIAGKVGRGHGMGVGVGPLAPVASENQRVTLTWGCV